MKKKETEANLDFSLDDYETDYKPEISQKTRPFEFRLMPEHVSASGKNLFRVIRCRYDYRYKRHTIRLEMCCGQSRVVKFQLWGYMDIEGFYESISKLKNALKKGLCVYIQLNDLCMLSYRFNNSSGISLYSTGFRIVGISSDENIFG